MMMQMPGQMRPDMPNIPQIKPSGMGQAAALPSEVDQLKRLPREQLMQALMSPGERPPKWAIVTALDQQAKENQMRQAQAGAAAQQQVAGLGTVAQEVASRSFARGGVVGFAGGGNPEIERILKKGPHSRTPEDNAKLEAAGIPLIRRTLPADSWLSNFDRWLASPFIREAITGGALNLSDEDLARRTDTAASNEKIARVFGAQQVPPATAPTAATTEYDPAADVARENYLLQRRSPTAPARTPAAQRGLGTGAPARTQPPAAATTSPPQTDGFDIKTLQEAIRAAGTVSPDVQSARDALRTQREASLSARERRRAGLEAEMSEKPSMGLAAAQIAAAMAGSNRLGEALARGAGAVANLQGAETKRLRELRRELMTMEDAEDSLREALAEKALAERSGDDTARKAADVRLLEAQRDYFDKQRTFRIQEEEARARTTAAERSGSGVAAGERNDIAALRAIIDSAQKTIDNMALPEAARQAAARQKANAERQLAAIAAGFSNVSTDDLLKSLGLTSGAK